LLSGDLKKFAEANTKVSSGGEEKEEEEEEELDREVEEFRLRLEAAKQTPPGYTRQKVNFTPQIWST